MAHAQVQPQLEAQRFMMYMLLRPAVRRHVCSRLADTMHSESYLGHLLDHDVSQTSATVSQGVLHASTGQDPAWLSTSCSWQPGMDMRYDAEE